MRESSFVMLGSQVTAMSGVTGADALLSAVASNDSSSPKGCAVFSEAVSRSDMSDSQVSENCT